MENFLRLIIVIGCIMLVGCSPDDRPQSALSAPRLFTASSGNRTLAGTWRYSNTIFSNADLTLYPDGTFSYKSEGCIGALKSAGKWAVSFEGVLLTSDDSFRTRAGGLEFSKNFFFSNEQFELEGDSLVYVGSMPELRGFRSGRLSDSR
ncbi:MAG: hypothetical protein EOP04_08685 [Proteobacteria bacterium]|nr:MAG: hypothetical protein EOP04_08685 [Pseudomonadota bacterium]